MTTTAPAPALDTGQCLVEVQYLSMDPAMRGWIDPTLTYTSVVQIGSVMRAIGGGTVVASRHPDLPVGSPVTGMVGVQRYAVLNGDSAQKVDPALGTLLDHIGLLGISGLTAYFGLINVAKTRPGDTVAISGAAGSVGNVVGQLAKTLGCHVIGIAGGRAKTQWLTQQCGFDAAIDYQNEDVASGLREHAPGGIDVFFDNVGGPVLDAALTRLAHGARVVVCGATSQLNAGEAIRGPNNYLRLIVKSARMEGFIVRTYSDQFDAARHQLSIWAREGHLTSFFDVVDGSVADFPDVFLKLFRGDNLGKLVLHLTS